MQLNYVVIIFCSSDFVIGDMKIVLPTTKLRVIANHLNLCGNLCLVKCLTLCLLMPLHWQTVEETTCYITALHILSRAFLWLQLLHL